MVIDLIKFNKAAVALNSTHREITTVGRQSHGCDGVNRPLVLLRCRSCSKRRWPFGTAIRFQLMKSKGDRFNLMLQLPRGSHPFSFLFIFPRFWCHLSDHGVMRGKDRRDGVLFVILFRSCRCAYLMPSTDFCLEVDDNSITQ